MVPRGPDRPADALAWKTHPWTIPIFALGGEHRYGPLVVDMLEGCAVDVSDGSITGRVHWLPEARPPETAEAVLSVLAGSRPAVHASDWEPA